MDYQTLQDRLREELPGTCIGFMDGTPYVVSARHEESLLRSKTMEIEPDYVGKFAYTPGGGFSYFNKIDWIDPLRNSRKPALPTESDRAA